MADKFSGLPASQRESDCIDGEGATAGARLSQVCYILVSLHILFFGYLAVVPDDPIRYTRSILHDEGGISEIFTALAFLASGALLFVAALLERRIVPRCVYVLGGMALAFFGGEELSWGQHIIGFATPDFLADLNYQGEFNVHNILAIDKVLFSGARRRELFFALGLIACAAFFCRKDRVLGIPSPPILLVLAFLVMMTAASYKEAPDFWSGFLRLTVTWQRGLLLLLLLYALFSRNVMLSVSVAASLLLALAIAYLGHYNSEHGGYWGDLEEHLFSLFCFFCALLALLDQRAARLKIEAAAAALKSAAGRVFNVRKTSILGVWGRGTGVKGGYLTPWTAFCAFIAAASVGLAVIVYFGDRADAVAFEDAYSLVRGLEPTARSDFNVYLIGRDLYYFKQPCDVVDTEARFFLAVFPTDVMSLRGDRRGAGFENLDFYFNEAYGSIADGVCIVRAGLPSFEIERIETGQFVWDEEGVAANLWSEEFPFR